MKKTNSNEINKIKYCDICGISSNEKIIRRGYGKTLCSKHYNQIYRNGKITDSSSETIQDKNKVINKGLYSEIIIHNFNKTIYYHVLVDTKNIEKLLKYKWCIMTFRNNNYVGTKIKNKTVYMTQIIMNHFGSEYYIDHINRNTLDNRECNLRIVKPVTNGQNIEHVKPKQLKNGKWNASVIRFSKQYNIGTFKTKEEAEVAIDLFYKEFANNELELLKQYSDEPHYKNIRKTISGKWCVSFTRNNKKKQIALCKTIEEAIAIRDNFLLNEKA